MFCSCLARRSRRRRPLPPSLNGHALRSDSDNHAIQRGSVQTATPRFKRPRLVETATPLQFRRPCPASPFKRPGHAARTGSNGHASVRTATPDSNGNAAPVQTVMPRAPIQTATSYGEARFKRLRLGSNRLAEFRWPCRSSSNVMLRARSKRPGLGSKRHAQFE